MSTSISDPTRPTTGALSRVETRSIDYVPTSERGGRFWDQATVWFAGSAQLLTLATGAIGISLGLNLAWTLIGLAIGTVLGTIPVSAHATQGPHLGLPQMIQSRPQFGRYGALIIWAMAIIVYWGYIVLGGNMLGATSAELTASSAPMWAVLTCLVAVALAIFGYHWLHIAQRIITVFLLVVIAIYLTGLAISGRIPLELFDITQSFDLGAFMVVVVAATGYQLTWAFFVSDYSRYMPRETGRGAIISVTSLGLFFGLFSFMAIGAICAALLPETGIIEALHQSGDWVFPGLGALMLIAGGLGLLGLMGMCAYGGSLTLITALDSIRTVRPTRRIRIVTILVIGLTATIAAALVPEDFLNNNLAIVLFVVGYFMAPWSAINLADFFVVRRGRYSIAEMFRRDGVYGLWNWRGIATYLVTLLIMVPFMNLGFYVGPVAELLGGVDIAFFVGIPVGWTLYWLLCLTQNIPAELESIKDADRDIDEYARPIE